MACCGRGGAKQQQSATAVARGLVTLHKATYDPNEPGPNWREDWLDLIIVFSGQRVPPHTIMRADAKEGYIDVYLFDIDNTYQLDESGQPKTNRMQGSVQIFAPSHYIWSIAERDARKALPWWEMLR